MNYNKFAPLFVRNKSNEFNPWCMRKHNDLYTEFCNILNINSPPLARLNWHFVNEITTIPICVICGSTVNWVRKYDSYAKYCSTICVSQSVDVKQKRIKTSLQNFGTTHPMKSERVVEKVKQIYIENYGVDHPTKTKQVRDKRIATNLARYGVEWGLQSPQIREKVKKTNLERYGGTMPMSDPDVRIKARNTNLERYGHNAPTENEEIKEKVKQTNIKKYGCHNKLSHINEHTRNLLDDKGWLTEEHHVKGKHLRTIAKELNVSPSLVGTRFKKFKIDVRGFQYSGEEYEMYEFVNQYTDVVANSRKIISPFEIDMYMPEFNTAIEYNGLVWHSEIFGGKNRLYHEKKYIKCDTKAIRLFTIFSNEWKNKRTIVESRLAYMLGKSDKIPAKKCKLVNIEPELEMSFFESNHLQGSCKSCICYGLTYNDQLVAVMSFGKSKTHEYELLRFCNILNHTITGGASKLFKHFVKEYNPRSVVSYSDKRWSDGALYLKLNFQHSHSVPPDYFYINILSDTTEVFTKEQFQNHKLKKLLEQYDPNLSEWDNMKNNGYDRIWDCGGDVWTYTFI